MRKNRRKSQRCDAPRHCNCAYSTRSDRKSGEHNSLVHSAKKGRKRIIPKERMEHDCPVEPDSGDEGGSGAARN